MGNKNETTQERYILADGDDVGAKLELHMLRNEVHDLKAQSEKLSAGLELVVEELRKYSRTEVIFAGGDDIMAYTQNREFATDAALRRIQEIYHKCCGQTLSIGIGRTPRSAHFALRMAKLLGKNQISRGQDGT